MYRFFVEKEQIGEKAIRIIGSDVNHIKNVLRMKPGEELLLSDGEKKEYHCQITDLTDDAVTAEIMFVKEEGLELPAKVYLFQGLPKNDKMELIIQKAVELGVYKVIPMATKRAVVKLDAKREEKKRARWQSIAESAAKQAKRLIIPEVMPVMSFKEGVAFAKSMEVRLLPYELAENMAYTREILGKIQPGQEIAVFIGPEGGFAEEEVELALAEGMSCITLGKRILRTETAGMTVLSILMYLLEP
jgi:16S rRNA (uracil1498-N3)-methyltransferase